MNKKCLMGIVLIALVHLMVPVHAEGCRIMAAGDQFITIAGSQPSPDYGEAGFRLPLQRSLAGLGLSCDWVGDTSAGYDLNESDGFVFDPDIVGGGILYADELAKVIGGKVSEFHPEVVIIYAGGYDVLAQMVPNGPGTSLQPPWLAAIDVALVVDTIHATDSEVQIVLMVPVTGINHYAPLEDLRTNVLSLMVARPFVDVVDTGRILIAPDEYITLELPTLFGAEKIAAALQGVIEPTIRLHQGSTTPVPLPAAVWLFGSALLGLVVFKRRGRVVSHR